MAFIDTVKQWFKKDATPSEEQFASLFDYLRFKDQKINIADVNDLTRTLNAIKSGIPPANPDDPALATAPTASDRLSFRATAPGVYVNKGNVEVTQVLWDSHVFVLVEWLGNGWVASGVVELDSINSHPQASVLDGSMWVINGVSKKEISLTANTSIDIVTKNGSEGYLYANMNSHTLTVGGIAINTTASKVLVSVSADSTGAYVLYRELPLATNSNIAQPTQTYSDDLDWWKPEKAAGTEAGILLISVNDSAYAAASTFAEWDAANSRFNFPNGSAPAGFGKAKTVIEGMESAITLSPAFNPGLVETKFTSAEMIIGQAGWSDNGGWFYTTTPGSETNIKMFKNKVRFLQLDSNALGAVYELFTRPVGGSWTSRGTGSRITGGNGTHVICEYNSGDSTDKEFKVVVITCDGANFGQVRNDEFSKFE